MAIEPRRGYSKAGLAGQWDQDVNAAPPALVTGDFPPLSGMDLPAAASQTIKDLAVLGLDVAGRLVPATYGGPPAYAKGVLTFSAVAVDGNTVTIGSAATGGQRVYRFSGNVNAANRVALGANIAACAANLVAAINGTGGDGYHADTEPHLAVAASAGNAAGAMVVTARHPGVQSNAIPTTENSANTSFADTTLQDGAGAIPPVGVYASGEIVIAAANYPWLPIHNTGVFNPEVLEWDDSFQTDVQKFTAFQYAPAYTHILIRKISTLR